MTTANVNLVLQVDPADISQQVAKIQEAAQSYTKADGEIVKLMLQKPALLLPKKCYMLSALIKVDVFTRHSTAHLQAVLSGIHGSIPRSSFVCFSADLSSTSLTHCCYEQLIAAVAALCSAHACQSRPCRANGAKWLVSKQSVFVINTCPVFQIYCTHVCIDIAPCLVGCRVVLL